MKMGFQWKGLVRRIEKVPPLYKFIVMIIIVGAVLFALVQFARAPKIAERDKLVKENIEVQKKLNTLRDIVKNMDKHRREYAEMQEVLLDVLKKLPESKDIPNLLRSVTSVSEETRLKVKFFEPKEIKTKEFYQELPFEMKFSGSFHNVAYFFDGIRKMERLVNVTNISLASKGNVSRPELEGTCSANAYVYSKDAAPKGKTDKKGKGGKGAPKK